MPWNYRAIQINKDTVGVFEVFYDDEGRIIGRTEKPIDLVGPDAEGRCCDLELIVEGLRKPTLRPSEEPGLGVFEENEDPLRYRSRALRGRINELM